MLTISSWKTSEEINRDLLEALDVIYYNCFQIRLSQEGIPVQTVVWYGSILEENEENEENEEEEEKVIVTLALTSNLDVSPLNKLSAREKEKATLIYNVGTHPVYRRQGYMRALLTSILALLPPNRQVYLEVDKRNTAAVQLYESLNFRPIRSLDEYYWLMKYQPQLKSEELI